MQVPLEISYKHFEKDEALEELIRERAAKLERICSYIISCRVAVEMDHMGKRTGNPVRVRATVRIPPGHEIAARREAVEGLVHSDAYTVATDTFDAVEQQLRKLMELQRGEVKDHPAQQTVAFVIKLMRDEGYGFIQTEDGQEVYFHKNSVLHNDFDRMDIGTGVTFSSEMGENGMQASTVQVTDKPRASKSVSGKKEGLADTGSPGKPH